MTNTSPDTEIFFQIKKQLNIVSFIIHCSCSQEWLPNIGVVYALTLIAFFFFVSMFPERWRPGTLKK